MNYCVYYHKTPAGKYYVGATSRNPLKRWSNGYGYKTQISFYKDIEKYGWCNIEHNVLARNLSEEDAFKLETWLIAKFKSENLSYNIAAGGKGTIGVFPSESTRKLLSESRLGRKHWHYGMKTSKETRQKISNSLLGHTPWNLGISPSEETKNKIKAALSGRKMSEKTAIGIRQSTIKRVVQMTPDGKNAIKEWDSAVEAARYFNIHPDGIGKCCRHLRKHAAGYMWEFLDKKDRNKYNNVYSKSHKKKVDQYSLNGDFIRSWDSAEEAAAHFKTSHSGISSCANGKYKSSNGFIWKYK